MTPSNVKEIVAYAEDCHCLKREEGGNVGEELCETSAKE